MQILTQKKTLFKNHKWQISPLGFFSKYKNSVTISNKVITDTVMYFTNKELTDIENLVNEEGSLENLFQSKDWLLEKKYYFSTWLGEDSPVNQILDKLVNILFIAERKMGAKTVGNLAETSTMVNDLLKQVRDDISIQKAA